MSNQETKKVEFTLSESIVMALQMAFEATGWTLPNDVVFEGLKIKAEGPQSLTTLGSNPLICRTVFIDTSVTRPEGKFTVHFVCELEKGVKRWNKKLVTIVTPGGFGGKTFKYPEQESPTLDKK